MATDRVAEYAHFLGLPLQSYPQLRHLLEEGLCAPLPPGWTLTFSDDDEDRIPLFFHAHSGVCLSEHPSDSAVRHRFQHAAQLIDSHGDVPATHPADVELDFHADSPIRQPSLELPSVLDDHMEMSPASSSMSREEIMILQTQIRQLQHEKQHLETKLIEVRRPVALSEFLCPITSEIMRDPVVTADGFTYERIAILKWFEKHATSPMTNQALPHKHLAPNLALKSQIVEYYSLVAQWEKEHQSLKL